MLLFNTSCKKKTINLGKEFFFESQESVSYGKDSEQKMDIYIPKNISTSKPDVFIMIHGGGWRGGEKSNLSFFTLSMMKKFPNHIFANIDYRLASASRFAIPDQTEDINNTMLYLEKTLQYKPKFILLGNSAGGHLSMLYAYKFDQAKKVKAVINIVGPSDLSDPNFKKYSDYSFVEKHLVDPKSLSSNISMMNFASPTHWIKNTSAPTLSYYGNNDQIIPLSQKAILDSLLHKNKVINESFEFNGGHLDSDKENNASFLMAKIDAFLKKIDHKKPSETNSEGWK